MIGERNTRQRVEDPLALAIQISHDAVVVIDMAGRIVLVNKRLLATTGFVTDDLIGAHVQRLLPANRLRDPRLGFLGQSHTARDETKEQREPVRVYRHDGSMFAAKLTTSSYCSPEHGPVSVLAIRSVRNLTLDEIGLRGLLESAPDATVILDGRCRVVLGNHRAAQLFGRPHDDLHEQSVAHLFGDASSGALTAWFDECYQEVKAGRDDGRTTPFVVTVKRPDGSTTPVEVAVTGLALDEGLLLRAAVRDVSGRLELQVEADRLKTNFLATVSHELRTPLTSILGYAELYGELPDDELPEAGRHFVEVITRNARREMRLVDDLLTIVGIGEGTMAVRPGLVDVRQVVTDAVEEAEPAAHAEQVHLEVDIAEGQLSVRGDADRLGQALDNVLSNAIKFTPPGGRVGVSVRVLPGVAGAAGLRGGTLVHIVVTDAGPGITEADRDRIFERFHRGQVAIGAEKPGAGLGLAIVKAIVEAHGGSVAVDSGPDGGAVVDIALPHANPAPHRLP